MTQIRLENVGPIRSSDVTFADLTVFVGPQATGKSIALQWLRLLIDRKYIFGELKRYGIDWSRQFDDFLDAYFGEGMKRLWRDDESTIHLDRALVDPRKWMTRSRGSVPSEAVFYIPAQRVLTLRNGWPRPFTDYSPGDPFIVREFSEKLRLLMEKEFSGSGSLFPRPQRLKMEFRRLLSESLFPNFDLEIEKVHAQRRLVLRRRGSEESLPFMVWSAGQREFVPLLLGLYWLMPGGGISRRDTIEWVVIEELEMGLHPQAISILLLIVLELLTRGYKVCLSTHAQHVLDVVWALGLLRANQGTPDDVLDLFGAPHTRQLRDVAKGALRKSAKVYYFDRNGLTHDITSLDPGSPHPDESSWGGLTEFSGRVADVVADVIAASEKRGRR